MYKAPAFLLSSCQPGFAANTSAPALPPALPTYCTALSNPQTHSRLQVSLETKHTIPDIILMKLFLWLGDGC